MNKIHTNIMLNLLCLASFALVGCLDRQPHNNGTDATIGGSDASVGNDTLLVDTAIATDSLQSDSLQPVCPPDGLPRLDIKLVKEAGKWVAQVRNVGCITAYWLRGCCGEGEPIAQVRGGQGKFIDASCSKFSGPCCDAIPQCTPLKPGKSTTIPVSALNERRCCGKTFRVALPFSVNATCIDTFESPALIATSNEVTLSTPDPCDGKADCGPNLSCDYAKEICVRREAWLVDYKCEPIPQQCSDKRSCACLGKTLCTGSHTACSMSKPNIVSCGCPNC